jgi:hypothetical protein
VHRLVPRLKRWQLVSIVVCFVLFFPFPTEMVPEWTMQFRDENGTPLSQVVVQQGWRSYTYFAASGYEQRCSDASGVVTFPKRRLWSGTLARVISPILASAMTLAHGSTGTDAYIQVFDNEFISDNYYWRDNMQLYTHYPEELPTEGKARPWKRDYIRSCKELGLLK